MMSLQCVGEEKNLVENFWGISTGTG